MAAVAATAGTSATTERGVVRGVSEDTLMKISIASSSNVQCIAISEDHSGTLLVTGAHANGGTFGAGHLPDRLNKHMRARSRTKPKVRLVAIGPSEEFYLAFQNGTSTWWHTDPAFTRRMAYTDPNTVRSVSFGVNHSWVVITTQFNYWSGVESPLLEEILWATRPVFQRPEVASTPGTMSPFGSSLSSFDGSLGSSTNSTCSSDSFTLGEGEEKDGDTCSQGSRPAVVPVATADETSTFTRDEVSEDSTMVSAEVQQDSITDVESSTGNVAPPPSGATTEQSQVVEVNEADSASTCSSNASSVDTEGQELELEGTVLRLQSVVRIRLAHRLVERRRNTIQFMQEEMAMMEDDDEHHTSAAPPGVKRLPAALILSVDEQEGEVVDATPASALSTDGAEQPSPPQQESVEEESVVESSVNARAKRVEETAMRLQEKKKIQQATKHNFFDPSHLTSLEDQFPNFQQRNNIALVALHPDNPDVFFVKYTDDTADWCIFNEKLQQAVEANVMPDVPMLKNFYFGPNNTFAALLRHNDQTPARELLYPEVMLTLETVTKGKAGTRAAQAQLSLRQESMLSRQRMDSTDVLGGASFAGSTTTSMAPTPLGTPRSTAGPPSLSRQDSITSRQGMDSGGQLPQGPPSLPASISSRVAGAPPPSATTNGQPPQPSQSNRTAVVPPLQSQARHGPATSAEMDADLKNAMRPRLRRFLTKYSPSRVKSMDILMAAYSDDFNKMFKDLVSEYGPEPTYDPEQDEEALEEERSRSSAATFVNGSGEVGMAPGSRAEAASPLGQQTPVAFASPASNDSISSAANNNISSMNTVQPITAATADRPLEGNPPQPPVGSLLSATNGAASAAGQESARTGSTATESRAPLPPESALSLLSASSDGRDMASDPNRPSSAGPAAAAAAAAWPGPTSRTGREGASSLIPLRGVLTFNQGQTTYVGQILNGKRHGWGLCTYTNHDSWSWYVGQWVEGVPGIGLLRLKNGILYFGLLDVYGKRHGLGSASYQDNPDPKQDRHFLSGFWNNDYPTWGLLTYKDKKHYTGEFETGLRSGAGCCFYPPGEEYLAYCGHFSADKFSSEPSMMRYANGSVFHGDITSKKGSRTPGPKDPFRDVMLDDTVRLEQLRLAALQYVEDQWPTSRGRMMVDDISNWRPTRGPKSRAVSRFLRGLDHLSLQGNFMSQIIFGWHGTADLNAFYTISREGFNTDKRSRQNQGPGEYFAMHYEDAISYCRNDVNVVLLCAIITGYHVTAIPNSCYVVNNPPSTSGVSFILPIAAVQFDTEMQFPIPFPRAYRWQFLWQASKDQWIPHEFHANAAIATAWNLYLTKKGPPNVSFEIPPLDETEVHHEYEIDFKTLVQTNRRTNFTRKVTYVNVPGVPLPLVEQLSNVLDIAEQ